MDEKSRFMLHCSVSFRVFVFVAAAPAMPMPARVDRCQYFPNIFHMHNGSSHPWNEQYLGI